MTEAHGKRSVTGAERKTASPAASVIQVTDVAGGAMIPIRAMPRASRSAIDGSRDGMLLVRLQSAPADGAANAELLGLLSRALDVPRRDLAIVSGESGRTKRVRVLGLGAATVTERLATTVSWNAR